MSYVAGPSICLYLDIGQELIKQKSCLSHPHQLARSVNAQCNCLYLPVPFWKFFLQFLIKLDLFHNSSAMQNDLIFQFKPTVREHLGCGCCRIISIKTRLEKIKKKKKFSSMQIWYPPPHNQVLVAFKLRDVPTLETTEQIPLVQRYTVYNSTNLRSLCDARELSHEYFRVVSSLKDQNIVFSIHIRKSKNRTLCRLFIVALLSNGN